MDDLSQDIARRLTDLNAAYYARYGQSIELMKAEVGHGSRYENEVAAAVVSRRGAWCECLDLPAEFSGTVGPVRARFVPNAELLSLLVAIEAASLVAAPDNTRRLMMFVVYTRRGIADSKEAFAFDYACDPGSMPSGPHRVGAFRPHDVPRFCRCRIDTDLVLPGTSVRRGAFAFIELAGERSLLLEMPQEAGEVWDLSEQAMHSVVQ